jgi:uncharacterized repeat protein (TIGR03803 family)
MSRNRKRLLTLGAVMLVVIIVIPVLSPGAGAASRYKTLYAFTGGKGNEDGGYPFAGVISDQAGNLYGTTENDGAYGSGTVFKLTSSEGGMWTETVLYSFCSLPNCSDGAYPFSNVIFDGAGNLYGTTTQGGSTNAPCPNNCGTVFKLSPHADGSWTESVLYAFCSLKGCSDGENPYSKLIFDDAGTLYGTTYKGGPGSDCGPCGVVFELTPQSNGSWTESVLYDFCSVSNCSDGANPAASVLFDAKGNLYGTTFYGGDARCTNGCGVVFKLTKKRDGRWTERVLHAFLAGNDGAFPYAGLIFDQVGNLYGTTSGGGGGSGPCFSGCGVVFELIPNADGSWTEKPLHQFTGNRDGAEPFGGLILDQLGNLYGTTTIAGNPRRGPCSGSGCGVVFKLSPNSKGGWRETVLHRFWDLPGDNPYASDLIFDAHGNLYGTTVGDVSPHSGSVFEITP